MGRFAGHNAAADLLGKALLPLQIGWYTTILDLGPWGAVYTNGWDRHVIATGFAAKVTKQTINCQRIYPPRTKKREDILAAAAPVVQVPPEWIQMGLRSQKRQDSLPSRLRMMNQQLFTPERLCTRSGVVGDAPIGRSVGGTLGRSCRWGRLVWVKALPFRLRWQHDRCTPE